MEACGLAHRSDLGAPLKAFGGFQHRHRQQLRIRFLWYFYQDGTIQLEIKLTGIVDTAGIDAGETPKYGTVVAAS